jgi:hypothetical protein
MKTISLTYRLFLVVGTIGLGGIAPPAFSESTNEVEVLQQVLETQQQQLDTLKWQVQKLEAQTEQNRTSAGKLIAVKPSGSEHNKKAPLSDADKYDRESPTASSVSYFGSASKAMIPGSETEVRVHGLLEFQMIHDSVGINNNRFDTADIPVGGGPSQTKFNVNPTQFAISTATPAGNDGALNTWLSIDLNGQLDRPEPRLRIAFAEYVNQEFGYSVLAGQTYSTMMDLRAVPETLDFALPAGLWQQRQPLLRFTKSLSEEMTTEVSLETPENVIYTNATPLTRWPDLAIAGTWFTDGKYTKHIRMAALVRDLQAQEVGGGDKDNALGWSVSGSAKLGLPFLGAKDNLKFTVHYGDGYGTQIKGMPREGVFDTVNNSLETIGIFGFYGGYQHFWSQKWRSNLAFGHVNARNPDISAPDTLDETSYTALNLIWSPYKPVTLGVEYLWGLREDKDGASGTSNRLLLSTKVVF